MEGLPRVPTIAPDMKIPDEKIPEDWIPKLREYIFIHYNDDPSKFEEAFKELENMRVNSFRYFNPDVESICNMKRYFAQLVMMKSRFPMEANEPLAVSFSWSDRSTDMTSGAMYEDINFELCCVMYNIGAFHAIIAANETRSDEDSCKKAFMNFQQAAWPFEYLRDKLGASKFASANFEPELLTFHIQLLSAQAHECLIERSINEKRTNSLIAKLARHASDSYFGLKLQLDQDILSDLVMSSKLKTWKRLCEAKGHFYDAIKRFYLGQQCDADELHGESVAHFAAALQSIKEAQKIINKDKRENESMKQAIAFALDIITQREAKIRKENDFVYHERVPKAEDCTQAEPVTKVQLLGFDPFDRSVSGDDLFAALLPANVLKGVSMYSEEKAKLKRETIQKIEKKDSELEQHLLALQLNQLNLDQSADEMRLPEELLQASAAFTAQPHAFSELLDKLEVVATKSSEAEIKLTSLKHRLLSVKCPQLEDDEGFKAVSSKVDELMDHHIQARANNLALQKALADQSEQLKLLALPLTELANKICDKAVNVSDTTEGKKLREMVGKVEEMRKGRIYFFNAFTSDLDNDDITNKVLAEKDFSMEALFEKELKKHEKSLQMINMNLEAQDKILTALTEANANFAECRRDIIENNEKRRSQSIALITAYQVFYGVKEKTEAATKFYNQLFALIQTLDKIISGMEQTFQGERERHEEQRLLAAEKAKLYRERIALESSEGFRATTENRRPKLGDYMAYYRSKLAPGAQQLPPPRSGNLSQQQIDTSGPSISPNSQQNSAVSFSNTTSTSSYSEEPFSKTSSDPYGMQVPVDSSASPHLPNTQHSKISPAMPPTTLQPRTSTYSPSNHAGMAHPSSQFQGPVQPSYLPPTSFQSPSPAPYKPFQGSSPVVASGINNQSQLNSSGTPNSIINPPPTMFAPQPGPNTSNGFSNANLPFPHSLQFSQASPVPQSYQNGNTQAQQKLPVFTSASTMPANGVPQSTQSNTVFSQPMHVPASMPSMQPFGHPPFAAPGNSNHPPNVVQAPNFQIPNNQTLQSSQSTQLPGQNVSSFAASQMNTSQISSQPIAPVAYTQSQQPPSSIAMSANSYVNQQQPNSAIYSQNGNLSYLPETGSAIPFQQPVSQNYQSNVSYSTNSVMSPIVSAASNQLPTPLPGSKHQQYQYSQNVPYGGANGVSNNAISIQPLKTQQQPATFPSNPVLPSNSGAVTPVSQHISAGVSADKAQASSVAYSTGSPNTSTLNAYSQPMMPNVPATSVLNTSMPTPSLPATQRPQASVPNVNSVNSQPPPSAANGAITSAALSSNISIAPSPYANAFKKTTPIANSPWHRNLPNQKPVTPNQTNYVSPFASQKPSQTTNQPSGGAQSPFQPISPAAALSATYYSVPNSNTPTPRAKDITSDLLDNLFATTQTPHDFSRQGSLPQPQPSTERPAATVLPMRRPDGTWASGPSDPILSFTNVQSVNLADAMPTASHGQSNVSATGGGPR